MNTALDQYGVVGHPVAHSWSPFIHSLFARETGQALTYRLHDVPAERFVEYVHAFAARGGRGLNVTVPHKVDAAGLATELSPRAARAKAANTLTFVESRILADNTDGAGLVRDLTLNLGLALANRRILIAGAGGAARGVLGPLLGLTPTEIAVAARNSGRAAALAQDFADLGAVRGCGFEALGAGAFDLVINATSAGLAGEVPAIPAGAITAGTVCYDMGYSRTDTAFVRWARGHGCERALQGWGMLVEQAAESFLIWRGIRPDTASVRALLPG